MWNHGRSLRRPGEDVYPWKLLVSNLLAAGDKKLASGRTAPYFCAGTARYVSHQGDRPMQIVWRLDHALPGDTFAAYRAAVV